MTRNDFIQRMAIQKYSRFIPSELRSDIRRFVNEVNEIADELEKNGIPFDIVPFNDSDVDADFNEEPTDEILRKPLKEFYEEGKISCRTFNVLKVAGAQTFGDVTNLTRLHMLKVRTCGKKTIADAENLLHEYGYDWAVYLLLVGDNCLQRLSILH